MTARRKAGFSLVELLVVIVVVAILSAIVIQVVSRVRVSASSTISKSNLRQIYAAIYLYAYDHGGTLPGPIYTGQGPRFAYGSPTTLPAMLDPYLESKNQSANYGYSPVMSYPAWEANTPSLAGPSYQVNVTPLPDKTLRPLGQLKGDPEKDIGTMRVMQLSAFDLSKFRWIYEIDQQCPGVGVASWASMTPETPVHITHRNTLMMDGAVVAIALNDF